MVLQLFLNEIYFIRIHSHTRHSLLLLFASPSSRQETCLFFFFFFLVLLLAGKGASKSIQGHCLAKPSNEALLSL